VEKRDEVHHRIEKTQIKKEEGTLNFSSRGRAILVGGQRSKERGKKKGSTGTIGIKKKSTRANEP